MLCRDSVEAPQFQPGATFWFGSLVLPRPSSSPNTKHEVSFTLLTLPAFYRSRFDFQVVSVLDRTKNLVLNKAFEMHVTLSDGTSCAINVKVSRRRIAGYRQAHHGDVDRAKFTLPKGRKLHLLAGPDSGFMFLASTESRDYVNLEHDAWYSFVVESSRSVQIVAVEMYCVDGKKPRRVLHNVTSTSGSPPQPGPAAPVDVKPPTPVNFNREAPDSQEQVPMSEPKLKRKPKEHRCQRQPKRQHVARLKSTMAAKLAEHIRAVVAAAAAEKLMYPES